MHFTKILFFSLLCLLFYSNFTTEQSFDFDAMDEAMIATGVDAKIEIKNPSRFELLLRRIADPILTVCIRSYMSLKKRYTRIIAFFKTYNKNTINDNNNNEKIKQ